MLLFVWAGAVVLQAILYLAQRRTRDATAVDAGWGFSLAATAVFAAIAGPGDSSHRILVGILGAAENGRVAVAVLRRFGHGEDGSYRDLRERWAARGREQLSFAIFYQAQAALAPCSAYRSSSPHSTVTAGSSRSSGPALRSGSPPSPSG
jgi:steroid 5-alpha reductase family enzyme